jgi:hypothetical protein
VGNVHSLSKGISSITPPMNKTCLHPKNNKIEKHKIIVIEKMEISKTLLDHSPI